jgi:hypothetical protein
MTEAIHRKPWSGNRWSLLAISSIPTTRRWIGAAGGAI